MRLQEIPQNRQQRHAGGDGLTRGVSWVRPQTSSSSLRRWWEQVSASHTGLSVGVKSAVSHLQCCTHVTRGSPGPSAELVPTSYLFWSSAAFLIHIIFSFFSMVLHVASMAFCAFGRSLYKTRGHIKSAEALSVTTGSWSEPKTSRPQTRRLVVLMRTLNLAR